MILQCCIAHMNRNRIGLNLNTNKTALKIFINCKRGASIMKTKSNIYLRRRAWRCETRICRIGNVAIVFTRNSTAKSVKLTEPYFYGNYSPRNWFITLSRYYSIYYFVNINNQQLFRLWYYCIMPRVYFNRLRWNLNNEYWTQLIHFQNSSSFLLWGVR